MKSIIFLFLTLVYSTYAHPQNLGDTCIQKAIQAGVAELVCPCGHPSIAPKKDSMTFVYTDQAYGPPIYIPEPHCGLGNDDAGLGKMHIRYKPLPDGDCDILAVELE